MAPGFIIVLGAAVIEYRWPLVGSAWLVAILLITHLASRAPTIEGGE